MEVVKLTLPAAVLVHNDDAQVDHKGVPSALLAVRIRIQDRRGKEYHSGAQNKGKGQDVPAAMEYRGYRGWT